MMVTKGSKGQNRKFSSFILAHSREVKPSEMSQKATRVTFSRRNIRSRMHEIIHFLHDLVRVDRALSWMS